MTGKVLITGSNGKLGRVLRQVWAREKRFQPIWQVRRDPLPGDLLWQIGQEWNGAALEGAVILHLAGGRGDLDENSALAQSIWDLAGDQGAAHVFVASSSAIYPPDDKADLDENREPQPTAAYGQAKLAMEQRLLSQPKAGTGLTLLRIGNVFGCDSLIGGARSDRPVSLTPVPGRRGGPQRSYIGPVSFGRVLADLIQRVFQGDPLPQVLNLGLAPAVSMADLLDAAALPWAFAPESPNVLGRLVLDVGRLAALVPLPVADPLAMAREWQELGMDRQARS